MPDMDDVQPRAKMLASLVNDGGHYMLAGVAVQRSHRFPSHIFVQIENLARMGDVPVSLVINELLFCGLDALKKELPAEKVRQMTLMTKEQVDRPMVQDHIEVKRGMKSEVIPRKSSTKLKSVKPK